MYAKGDSTVHRINTDITDTKNATINYLITPPPTTIPAAPAHTTITISTHGAFIPPIHKDKTASVV
jgi:hypothetical protein